MLINIIEKLEKIITFIIKAIIFLLPLFFLPWTTEYFEFNKQFLLRLVMPLAMFLWLGKMAWRQELKFKRSILNLPILMFLSLAFKGTLF